MARKFRIGRLPKNYARKKVVNKRKRMPAYQDSRQKQEPSLSSSHESLDDEFSSPTIIDLVDHDGMSTTLSQTSEEPSRTLSSLNNH